MIYLDLLLARGFQIRCQVRRRRGLRRYCYTAQRGHVSLLAPADNKKKEKLDWQSRKSGGPLGSNDVPAAGCAGVGEELNQPISWLQSDATFVFLCFPRGS